MKVWKIKITWEIFFEMGSETKKYHFLYLLEMQGALHPPFLGIQNMNLVCITPIGSNNKNCHFLYIFGGDGMTN